ncbi:MAG: hypothetical protein LBS60_05535 [Deltaproteobacteria bacterium]|jgi:hypothetical protein|nr:hypothetical protein [Deltaproteobacteria bacterium]
MLLPEVKLIRIDKDKVHFKYMTDEDNSIFGHRNKIGGKPDWIQTEEIPLCPHCQKK